MLYIYEYFKLSFMEFSLFYFVQYMNHFIIILKKMYVAIYINQIYGKLIFIIFAGIFNKMQIEYLYYIVFSSV